MRFKKGFSLIELLIVIAIIGILTSVIFISMANTGVNNDLKNAGRQLASAIRETQSYALSGKTKEGFYPCAFRFSTDIKKNDFYYKIEYIPREVNQQCGDNDSGFEEFEGPFKFEKIESLSLKSVVFLVPHATYSSVEKEKTEFILRKKGKEYKVTVFSSGLVQEGDEDIGE